MCCGGGELYPQLRHRGVQPSASSATKVTPGAFTSSWYQASAARCQATAQLPRPACTLLSLPAPHLHKALRNGYEMTSSCLYPVLTRQAIRKAEPGVARAWLAIQEQFGQLFALYSLALANCFFYRLLSFNWIHRLLLVLLAPLLHRIPVMTTPSIILMALAPILA